MKNQYILFIILFISLTIQLSAQEKGITIYQTFEDYKASKGIFHDGDFDFTGSKVKGSKKASCTFKKRGKDIPKKERKLNVKLKENWGFKFNNQLIRIANDNEPYRVMSIGEIIYYEYGLIHLNVKNIPFIDGEPVHKMAISKNLNSEIIGLEGERVNRAKIKKFSKENPETTAFFDCCKKKYANKTKVRKCVENFNNQKLPE